MKNNKKGVYQTMNTQYVNNTINIVRLLYDRGLVNITQMKDLFALVNGIAKSLYGSDGYREYINFATKTAATCDSAAEFKRACVTEYI